MKKKLAVLSRYSEMDGTWLQRLKKEGYETLVYNKKSGPNLLPNVGREGHTYLHYIINNYNNLPNEILFTQYDPMDHFRRKDPWNRRGEHHIQSFLRGDVFDSIFLNPMDYDLFVRGRAINWISYYQTLYDTKNIDIDQIVASGACINGIFRVSKEMILKHDIDFYHRAIKMLDHHVNPVQGFFFERAWRYIFSDYGFIDNEKFNYFADSIYCFGNYVRQRYAKTRRNEAYGHLRFSKDGTIGSNGVSLYRSINESHWNIKNSSLRIMATNGAVTSVYDLSDYKKEQQEELWGCYIDRTTDRIIDRFFWLRPALWPDYFSDPSKYPSGKKMPYD